MDKNSQLTNKRQFFTNRWTQFLGIFITFLISISWMSTSQADGHAKASSTNLYVATNKADGNTIVHYGKSSSGEFKELGEYATGGLGTGDLEIPALKKDPTHPLLNGDDPLISAYSVITTDDNKHLLAVNPGDASISLMRVDDSGKLSLVNKVKSSDRFPVSLASTGSSVIGASVGKDNNHGSISAYQIDSDGWLAVVPNSRRDLKARPSTIGFTADNNFVVVTELVTGKIKTFKLSEGQLSTNPISTIDSPRDEGRFQAIPVGFDVTAGKSGSNLIVSEARFLNEEFALREEKGVVPLSPKYSWQTGSLSSYRVDSAGKIELVSADVLTGSKIEGGEIANCWVTLSPDGKTLWAANALSSSISTFNIGKDSTSTLKNLTAYKDNSELLFFSDLAVNESGTELYQLVGNKGQVAIFSIDKRGDLKLTQMIGSMPSLGTYGLATIEL